MHVGPSSLTRDGTQAPCIGSSESYPLRHQGSPSYLCYLIPPTIFGLLCFSFSNSLNWIWILVGMSYSSMYRQCNYIDLKGSLGLEYLELQVRAVAPWCHLCTRFILSFHRSIISAWISLSYFWLHSSKMAAPFPASICISQRKENRGDVEWGGGSATKKAKPFRRKPQRIYRWP